MAAHFQEIAWELDLSRRPNGSFVHHASVGYTADTTDALGTDSDTAKVMLTYATALKKIYLTLYCSWTNVTSTNLSFSVTALTPNAPYYFTFRATNTADVLWATDVLNFTTLALTPTPVLPVSGVTIANGVPSFSFTAAARCKYRLNYKNALTDAVWTPGTWSPNATGSDRSMTLTDPSATDQPQRFYRIEAANP